MNLSEITGITSEEEQLLRVAGISTSDDLWHVIGYDQAHGIDVLSEQTSIGRVRLIGLLADQAVAEAELQNNQRLRLILANGFWIMGLALLLLLAIRMLFLAPVSKTTSIVVATRDLPAYTVITNTDITTTTTEVLPIGAITNSQEVVGKVTLEPLHASDPLSLSALLSLPKSSEGWWLLTIPSSSALPITIGDTVVVLGVEDSRPDAEIISEQAVVVHIGKDSVVIALAPAKARLAGRYLLNNRHVLVVNKLR